MKSRFPSILLAVAICSICLNIGNTCRAQVLVNGANTDGTIYSNTVADSYIFTANVGDNINVRLATTGFHGYLQLLGPGGASLGVADANGTQDYPIAVTATNSGTFTVLVSSYYAGGSGTYVLNLSQIPESFVVPPGYGGGPLTNGANAPGTITLGRQDMWTFTANVGDSINVRLGTTGFTGFLQLYAPNGALLATEYGNGVHDDLIGSMVATNSGTFTVFVSSLVGGTGTYVLNLSQIPESFVVPPGYGGGPLTNGVNATGTITLGRQDLWTFTANVGDSINVRLGTTGFAGYLQLYAPNGALLATEYGDGVHDDLIGDMVATNSGTFTVLVSSLQGDTGTYVLNLSQIPEPFIVPAGYGGGPLTNGINATGTITLGRQDLWTFAANKGDNINVRLGTTGFAGYLQLYAPNGALLATEYGDGVHDDLIGDMVATNNGTFTVLVSSLQGGTGTYVLNLSQIPEPFIVPAGYGGGPLTNGASESGTITLARQDLWTFVAYPGDSIDVRISSTNLYSTLRLYGPNGAALASAGGIGYNWSLPYTATNSGNFTVLVSGSDSGDIGTYVLSLSQVPEAKYLTWAQHYFGCTNCSQASEFADSDGNGLINYDKFASGFNPINSATYPHIMSIAATNSTTDIRVLYLGANGDSTYTGGPGSRTNVLEFTTGAPNGSYSNNYVSTGHTNILSGGTGLGIVTNMIDIGGATNLPARFYRIRVTAP